MLALIFALRVLTIDVAARALQPGELFVVTVTVSDAVPAVTVRAFDQTWPAWRVDDQTWRALAGIDLDVKPGKYTLTVDAAGQRASRPLVVTSKTFRTRTLTVDEAFVNPPASVQPRIAEEARRLNDIWRSSGAERLWNDTFLAPVPQPANSAFGTRSVYNGQPRSAHGGADFASPAGTPIRSPNSGRIVLAADLYYTGRTVVIDHGMGLVSLFAHLSEIAVTEGTTVSRGDVLGRVGATGRVTGAHLHWTLRASGARVDPISLLELMR